MFKRVWSIGACAVAVGTVLVAGTSVAIAQPDVSVSRLGLTSGGSGSEDFAYYGVSGGIRAFAIASTSCNVGNQTAEWIDGNSGNHPVIAQNMYRLLNGRFEQIGMSWLKHSFCAVSEPTCGSCVGTPCSSLGVGCADTYWAGLNGQQGGLGPRSQINPQGQGSGGTHTDPHPFPTGPNNIRGRLQIMDTDILAGGRNFAEIHYVTHDEPLTNRYNNASWREVNLNLTSIIGVQPGQASVHFQEAAIFAWPAIDPTAIVGKVNVPGEGRFHLGSKVTDLGNGTWDYEYAVENVNSDRAAGSFSVPIPAGVTVINTGFHDISYHSGDGIGGVNYDGTDWPASQSGGQLIWTTDAFSINQNANAIRWGTLYNFRFVANVGPDPAQQNVTIGLFKPGTPSVVQGRAFVPSVPVGCATVVHGDMNADALVNGADIDRFTQILVNGGASTNEVCAGDLDGSADGLITMTDLPAFVSCLLAGGCP